MSALLLAAALAMVGQAPAASAERTLAAAAIPFAYDVVPNVVYVQRGRWEGKLDLMLPVDAAQAAGVLVWFHGGGWTRSSKETEWLYVLPYLARGWAVVNVEYRLAADSPAPGAIEDAACALSWVARHGAEYGLRLDRVVSSGISAGGGTALLAGVWPGDADTECEPLGSHDRPKIKAIVNWFGPSDLVDLTIGAHPQSQVREWFARAPDAEHLAHRLSVVEHLDAHASPVITIHGQRDDVIPYAQSVRLHARLDDLGIPNQLVSVDASHGDLDAKQAGFAFDAIFAFLDQLDVSATSTGHP